MAAFTKAAREAECDDLHPKDRAAAAKNDDAH
jgi:hypothetical protein